FTASSIALAMRSGMVRVKSLLKETSMMTFLAIFLLLSDPFGVANAQQRGRRPVRPEEGRARVSD
ncbi:hypothetical protein, partial [Citrobacter youngae]|uniref:hypothetical protein n=1 Tax=Citrobacter youngae TaxID=133448 RepID=UPI001952A910